MSLDRVASTANILAHWVQASEDIEELRAIITLLERSPKESRYRPAWPISKGRCPMAKLCFRWWFCLSMLFLFWAGQYFRWSAQ